MNKIQENILVLFSCHTDVSLTFYPTGWTAFALWFFSLQAYLSAADCAIETSKAVSSQLC